MSRYGGATASVTVALSDGRQLHLDAGTGIRMAPITPANDPMAPHLILLSHTHWDHIQGLPFFRPLYNPAATVRVIGPDQPEAPLDTIIARLFDRSVWPAAVQADLRINSITEGAILELDGMVEAIALKHPGHCLGYRLTDPLGPTVSYITDNELGIMHPSHRERLVHFTGGVDVLIHDATYADRPDAGELGWGHTGTLEALALAREAGCGRLVFFHHSPDACDQDLDRRLREAERVLGNQEDITLIMAHDGLVVDL